MGAERSTLAMRFRDLTVYEDVGEDRLARYLEGPECEECGDPIPAADVREYRAEAGHAAEPRCCSDCAEAPEPG